MTVIEYIKQSFPLCVRENKEDDGTLIGLPYPYTVPCTSDSFQELYYWDTYFVNKALILLGNVEMAKNNVDNMITLIDRYGFMPNGSRTYYLNNTQPPFFSEMIKDIYAVTNDKQWLEKAVQALIKEHKFWNEQRNTEIGLAQYKGYMGDFDSVDVELSVEDYVRRIKYNPTDISKEQIAKQARAAYESGWDMSARFGFSVENYVQIDLNSLLCAMEKNIGYFLNELNQDDSFWIDSYEKRLTLMRKYMLHEGVFFDYDFKKDKINTFFTCASFYPMWLNLLTEDEAKKIYNEIGRLEAPYGLYAAEKNEEYNYNFQWGYPNAWAPLHTIVIEGLLNYGFVDKAVEIAKKYVLLIDRNFAEHNDLFEKYNAEDGSLNAITEGRVWPRAMIGWTAATYVYAQSVIDRF